PAPQRHGAGAVEFVEPPAPEDADRAGPTGRCTAYLVVRRARLQVSHAQRHRVSRGGRWRGGGAVGLARESLPDHHLTLSGSIPKPGTERGLQGLLEVGLWYHI